MQIGHILLLISAQQRIHLLWVQVNLNCFNRLIGISLKEHVKENVVATIAI